MQHRDSFWNNYAALSKPVLARSASSAINTGFLCHLPSLCSSVLPPSSRVLHKYVHLFNFLFFSSSLDSDYLPPHLSSFWPSRPHLPLQQKGKVLSRKHSERQKIKGQSFTILQCSKTAFLIFVLFSFSLFFFFLFFFFLFSFLFPLLFFCFVPGNGMVTFSRLPENTTTSVGCVSRDGTNCVRQNHNARVCRRSC